MRAIKRLVLAVIVLILVLLALVLLLPRSATVAKKTLKEKKIEYSDHSAVFEKMNITKYEGALSCVECHEDEVKDVFHSYHYQMLTEIDDIVGKGRILYGGKYAYNDFCGSIFLKGDIPVNYIGKAILKKPPAEYADLKGKFIASGCSMCHGVSMGRIPRYGELTEDQIKNMDCLVCHADPEVYPAGSKGVKKGTKQITKDSTGWHYVVTVPIEKLAKAIVSTPPKDQCLLCHAYSGGGPGFKRPNLDPSLLGEVDEHIDVHLARGMNCTDCHVSEKHEMAIKGPDSWSRTTEARAPRCADCHERRHTRPLIGWILSTFHEDKVACQTCHIPHFAKKIKTDMRRDWSKAEFSPKLGRWEPHFQFEDMVEPVYLWWNEETRIVYTYPDPVTPDEEGKVVYMKPAGEKARGFIIYKTEGKIYPFKYHEAVVPYDEGAKKPVPVKVGVVFATGDVKKAAEVGAKIAGLKFDGKYITLVRYMAVNHGVEPASSSLKCFDCHGPVVRRMHWSDLGYGYYPEIAFTLGMLFALIVLGGVVYWAVKK